MNKKQLYKQLISALEATHQGAVDAAKRAYNTATDNENIAENKYDTLALEAAYLAHGQSQRVKECADDLAAFQLLNTIATSSLSSVCLGALVVLADIEDNKKYVFFAPVAGGLKVQCGDNEVVVVTPSSPFGKAINQRSVGDEIIVAIASNELSYEIISIY